MNRLILIGNGFDIAHGLPTKYSEFINNYWENTISEIEELGQTKYENDEILIEFLPMNFNKNMSYHDLLKSLKERSLEIVFKNKFLGIISKKLSINSWVDIEKEYYRLLKELISDDSYSIIDLNNDFNRIKELLNSYLTKIENDSGERNKDLLIRINGNIGGKIYAPYELKDFSEEYKEYRSKYELSKLEKVKENMVSYENMDKKLKLINIALKGIFTSKAMKDILMSYKSNGLFNFIPDETLVLNFNYTTTERYYGRPRDFENYNNDFVTKSSLIHIHGEIDIYKKSPIIFGFGDELDEEYKSIENLDDNNYLENIKSINYQDSKNYKNLLEFLNNDHYQVFVMGHSCGISDRTLLNTIFEHDNCSSIKPFYFEDEDGKDNYSDIVRNISRNFNSKVKMRDRVTNKEYCESMIS